MPEEQTPVPEGTAGEAESIAPDDQPVAGPEEGQPGEKPETQPEGSEGETTPEQPDESLDEVRAHRAFLQTKYQELKKDYDEVKGLLPDEPQTFDLPQEEQPEEEQPKPEDEDYGGDEYLQSIAKLVDHRFNVLQQNLTGTLTKWQQQQLNAQLQSAVAEETAKTRNAIETYRKKVDIDDQHLSTILDRAGRFVGIDPKNLRPGDMRRLGELTLEMMSTHAMQSAIEQRAQKAESTASQKAAAMLATTQPTGASGGPGASGKSENDRLADEIAPDDDPIG